MVHHQNKMITAHRSLVVLNVFIVMRCGNASMNPGSYSETPSTPSPS